MVRREPGSEKSLLDYTRSELSGGKLHAELSDIWITPYKTIYGGYAAAVAVRAVANAVKPRRPVSMSANFVRVIQPGEVEIELQQLRSTRRTEVTGVRMVQSGEDVLLATVWSIDDVRNMELPVPMLEHNFTSLSGVTQPARNATPSRDATRSRPSGASNVGCSRNSTTAMEFATRAQLPASG